MCGLYSDTPAGLQAEAVDCFHTCLAAPHASFAGFCIALVEFYVAQSFLLGAVPARVVGWENDSTSRSSY